MRSKNLRHLRSLRVASLVFSVLFILAVFTSVSWAAVVQLAAGSGNTIALKSDGTIWTWGAYALGTGINEYSSVPVQVNNLTGVVDVSTRNGSTVVAKSDGTVWAWGRNDQGRLGNGTYTSSDVPVRVSNLTGVVDVAAGDFHMAAVKFDGTVWAWGYNFCRILGNATFDTNNSNVPVQVDNLAGVVAVAAGGSHTLALKSDGTVWTWGEILFTENGGMCTAPPVQVNNLTGVVAVDVFDGHSVALKSDGTVWAWGWNDHGQLGNGTNTFSEVPVRVSNLTGVVAVAAGEKHTVALKSDGTVWAWGWNDHGQLGNDTYTSSWVPVQVNNITGAIAVAAGNRHTVALKSDGTVWAWGSNTVGQLGNFTYEGSNVPVQVYIPPTANAGSNQTVRLGDLVTLDGSASYDPDGYVPLVYAWSFNAEGFMTKPQGSSASLTNPTSVNPSFIPDVPGTYCVKLIVTNSIGVPSKPVWVIISTLNVAPVAEAGSDQTVTVVGSSVQLDGSQSYDPDGDWITYQWSFLSVPEGSAAALSNATSATPNFAADVHGTYMVQLVVSDSWSQSSADTMTISFDNVKPVSNAGLSQSAIVGNTVTLNGSGSSDANGDLLSFQWAFTSIPAGSMSTLASPADSITTFVPDTAGTYVAQLVVNDGYVDSDPSTIQVLAATAETVAVRETQDIQTIITSLDASDLKNTSMQNALMNKLNSVLANIEAGNYQSAMNQLKNDILPKTDGCVTAGAPDQNDWITNCADQEQVYLSVMRLIELLKSMI